MAKHGLYDSSPKMEHDEHGKVHVTKPAHKEGKEHKSDTSANLEVHEDHEMHGHHSLERHLLHAKHEHEHAMHKGGDKKEMHARHLKEHKEMHTRHEKMGHTSGAQSTVDQPIKKVEEGAK